MCVPSYLVGGLVFPISPITRSLTIHYIVKHSFPRPVPIFESLKKRLSAYVDTHGLVYKHSVWPYYKNDLSTVVINAHVDQLLAGETTGD